MTSAPMYNDPLGTLLNRLQGLNHHQPDLPGLSAFVDQPETAVKTRNDLFHALPVKDGLHRRTAKDATYVRNFYTVEDVRKAVEELVATHRAGFGVLYHDGAAAVRAWYEKGGS
jgi:hypothetical protein